MAKHVLDRKGAVDHTIPPGDMGASHIHRIGAGAKPPDVRSLRMHEIAGVVDQTFQSAWRQRGDCILSCPILDLVKAFRDVVVKGHDVSSFWVMLALAERQQA